MRGAPITVGCDCGQTQAVAYGESWTCSDCGRRWDTAQIPADEYWSVMRGMRRYWLWPAVVTAGLVVCLLVLGILAGVRFFIATPIVLIGYYTFFMPYWRRKRRARIRDLPSWKLRAE